MGHNLNTSDEISSVSEEENTNTLLHVVNSVADLFVVWMAYEVDIRTGTRKPKTQDCQIESESGSRDGAEEQEPILVKYEENTVPTR